MRIRFLPFLLVSLLVLSCDSSEENHNDPAHASAGGKVPPAEAVRSVSTGNIRVESPRPGQTLGATSFTVQGTARTFEGNVLYRLIYDSVITLVNGYTTAAAKEPGKFGPFSIKVDYTTDWGGPAVLEVYEIDAESGKEVNMVRIPVNLPAPRPGKTKQIYVYFANEGMGEGAKVDCRAVYPVRRELPENSVAFARGALYYLLKGPGPQEVEGGYQTRLPEGVRLQSLNLDSGIVRLEFSHQLNQIKKECSAELVRVQVEQTLAQFPTVNAVAIGVEGKTWTAGP